ncbi:glutathione S-transferase family protein [Kordiimonas pumila]|uniref:Glutathione S-transferase family protein n=1 Tax=Kordiimonas pumila TaxID=2161677 RepID=A0ABV7D0M5_9PROT|nr:glutathione S-transferase family protein [Kordiimonas pumila]
MANKTLVIGNKNYSSWSLRGWLALRHSGLEFKEIKLQLDTPSFHREIKKYNPAGKVPTLLDGNIRVWDSIAIIDYCAVVAPDKFWWPKDMKSLALARSITAEMHSGFPHVRNHLPMNMRLNWHGTFGDKVQADIDRIDAIWSECRAASHTKGDFLFGGFSAADMMYAPVVSRFLTYNVQLGTTAKAYVDAVRQHPYMKEWYSEAAQEKDIVPMDEIDPGAKQLG